MLPRGETLRARRYQLKQEVSANNRGQVYLAYDTHEGQELAIKIHHKDRKNLHMMRPIVLQQQLRHPRILPILDVFDCHSSVYTVTPWAAKGDLLCLLQNEWPLARDDAMAIFRQLMEAVEFMHQQGVVHRDIKLENILVDGHNRIYLADFEFSHRQPAGCSLTHVCGSYQNLSPEMLDKVLHRDRQTAYDGYANDVWMCGIVLHYLLLGRYPFAPRNKNRITALSSLSKFYLEHGSGVTGDGADMVWLKKMLAKDPLQRPSSSEILYSSWLQSGYRHPRLFTSRYGKQREKIRRCFSI